MRSGEAAGAQEVREEARRLAAIAGPGAPTVLDLVDDGSRVQLVVAVAPPLNLFALPTAGAFDALARVADVLQRANAAGISHGPIRDNDILGDGMSVLLTGWHRAADLGRGHDVVEFGRFIERLAVHHPELGGIATRALAPDPPTFAALAISLRDAIPRERLERRPPRRWPIVAVLTVALGAAALGFATAAPSHRSRAVVLESPDPVSTHGNVVERSGHRWVVGGPDDVVVTGAWNCDARQLPAVLRTRIGQVWLFAAWPAHAAPVIDPHATDVPGAIDLRVETEGRCDHLVAVDRQGRAIVVR